MLMQAQVVRKPLTGAVVRDVYAQVLPRFGAHVVDRADDALMAAVGSFLGALGVVDTEAWLTRYATTVGDRIYLPFVPGDPGVWPLARQLETLAHELVHVGQWGDPAFAVTYAGSSARRALWEAAGYAAGCEVRWAIQGTVGDLDQVAATLQEGYGCGRADAIAARVALERYAGVIRRGRSVARAAKAVVGALRVAEVIT